MTTSEPLGATGPPSDPESWTDEQWLTWLKETDQAATIDGIREPIASRVAKSAGGQVLGDAMKGLANAIYGPKDEEIVIMIEVGGQSHDDQPFTVHIDREHPERSTAVFSVENPDE